MIDIKDILTSWITSINPSDLEKKLAEERMEICMSCEIKREFFHNKEWSAICGRCGCPLKKKIFTNQYGTCPLKKWHTIEENYKNHLKIKKNSII